MKVDVYFRMTLNVDDAETGEEALTAGKFEAHRLANEINKLDVPYLSVTSLVVASNISISYANN